MRFNLNDGHAEGETRTVVRFAYLPVNITSTTTYMWLEKFYSTEQLVSVEAYEGIDHLEWIRIEANPVKE